MSDSPRVRISVQQIVTEKETLQERRKIMKRIAFVAIVLSLAVLAVPSVLAQKVIDRDSVAYGRTYSEWSAAWEQWSYSIPASQHPLFDNGDCSVGQSGPVWFLGGKFCYNGGTCSYKGVV